MKISEILNEIDASPVEPNVHSSDVYLEQYLKDTYGDHLQSAGEGSFSAVFDVPHLTGTVLKKGKLIMGQRSWANPDGVYYDDSYVNYILAIQQHQGFPDSLGNPYFPQIHKLDFFDQGIKDRNGNAVYKFTAEIESLKTLPGGVVSDSGKPVEQKDFLKFLEDNPYELVSQVLSAMKRISDFSVKTLLEYSQKKETEVNLDDLFNTYFRSLVGETSGKKIVVEPTDSTLKQAIILLKRFGKQYIGEWDIHSGNVMYRATPYGIQFVFTDVFA